MGFSELVKELSQGREIEFSYHGKRYSITNSAGYWNFCCDTDSVVIERLCPFDNREELVKRISKQCIDGISVPAIFNESQYDTQSLCIL